MQCIVNKKGRQPRAEPASKHPISVYSGICSNISMAVTLVYNNVHSDYVIYNDVNDHYIYRVYVTVLSTSLNYQ